MTQSEGQGRGATSRLPKPNRHPAGAVMARIEQLALRTERVKGMGRAMLTLPGLTAGLFIVGPRYSR